MPVRHDDPVPQVQATDASGMTALLLACRRGDLSCVRTLLKHDPVAQLKAADRHGQTALIVATSRQHVDCVRELLAHEAAAQQVWIRSAACGRRARAAGAYEGRAAGVDVEILEGGANLGNRSAACGRSARAAGAYEGRAAGVDVEILEGGPTSVIGLQHVDGVRELLVHTKAAQQVWMSKYWRGGQSR
eukprot:365324-Chlamydomonas_euryale.AAC.3